MKNSNKIMACHNANKSSCAFDIPVPQCFTTPMFVKEKRLLGAGPSNPPNDVLKALSLPMMGHLHPETLKVCLFIALIKKIHNSITITMIWINMVLLDHTDYG